MRSDGKQLSEQVLKGDHRAIARAITLVESGQQLGEELHEQLFPRTGGAFSIGITGSPGAGKSTLVDQLVAQFRREGLTVGVLAIDPSSPFTRGALLGDRVRMRSFASDTGVFIRSMANRGHMGGLALATASAVRVMDAAGFDRIIVETVGVGQSEIDVVETVDCTVVVEVPGMGDSIQTMKAGLMEIADQFVVNKADREGAARVVGGLRRLLSEKNGTRTSGEVLSTIANRGTGVPELVEALERFYAERRENGALGERRFSNLKNEVIAFVGQYARRRLVGSVENGLPEDILEALRQRRRPPESLALDIVDAGLIAHAHAREARG